MKDKIYNKTGKLLMRYKHAILSGAILSISLLVSVYLFGELHPVIAAVGGLLFAIPIRFFWHIYTSPDLRFTGVEVAPIHLAADKKWEYRASRIIVENKGRRAAKNCKGYIVIGVRKERVCWTVPKERPNATINAKDTERLDVCAFYKSGPSHTGPLVITKGDKEVPTIIAPTEEGWDDPGKCRDLSGIEPSKVIITADNAEPVEAQIKIEKEKEEIEILTASKAL